MWFKNARMVDFVTVAFQNIVVNCVLVVWATNISLWCFKYMTQLRNSAVMDVCSRLIDDMMSEFKSMVFLTLQFNELKHKKRKQFGVMIVRISLTYNQLVHRPQCVFNQRVNKYSQIKYNWIFNRNLNLW